MAILNPDGTPYNPTGSLRQYNPKSPEHRLFNLWDEELIKVSGTPLFYYELFIQQNTLDPIHNEDRGKLWSPEPTALYCYYEPVPSKNEMTNFGIDSLIEMKFELNYAATLRILGHPPVIGSRLFTPHLNENWEIIQRNLGEFKKWGAVRLELICRNFQESTTTSEGTSQKQTNINISDSLNI